MLRESDTTGISTSDTTLVLGPPELQLLSFVSCLSRICRKIHRLFGKVRQ